MSLGHFEGGSYFSFYDLHFRMYENAKLFKKKSGTRWDPWGPSHAM